jgi:hypothetical protein
VGFPRLFRGPLGLSLTIGPEHLGASVGTPQMLVLVDGTFFPWLLCYSVGTRWRTRGSSPRSLEGVWYSSKVLFAVSSLCEAFISAGLGDISAGLRGTVRMCRHSRAFGAYLLT